VQCFFFYHKRVNGGNSDTSLPFKNPQFGERTFLKHGPVAQLYAQVGPHHLGGITPRWRPSAIKKKEDPFGHGTRRNKENHVLPVVGIFSTPFPPHSIRTKWLLSFPLSVSFFLFSVWQAEALSLLASEENKTNVLFFPFLVL
jgi:hypothetical protein